MILNGFQKIIFQNRYVELETPPPFMEKNILNLRFDYLQISLMNTNLITWVEFSVNWLSVWLLKLCDAA